MPGYRDYHQTGVYPYGDNSFDPNGSMSNPNYGNAGAIGDIWKSLSALLGSEDPNVQDALGILFTGMLGGGGTKGQNLDMYRVKPSTTGYQFPFGGYVPTLYNQGRQIRSFDTNYGANFGGAGQTGTGAFNAGRLDPGNVPPLFSGLQFGGNRTGIGNNSYEQLFRSNDHYRRSYIPAFPYGGPMPSTAYPSDEPVTQVLPIQTEKNEKIYFGNGSVTDVRATDLHKDMKKDQVTDMFPDIAYVFSDKLFVTKKELKDPFGYTYIPYSEDSSMFKKMPEKISYDKFFGDDKKLSFAELAERIKKGIKIPGDELMNDDFAQVTKEDNLQMRKMFLDPLVVLGEIKRFEKNGGKDLVTGDLGTTDANQNEGIATFKWGGTHKKAKKAEFGVGDAASGLGDAFSSIANMIPNLITGVSNLIGAKKLKNAFLPQFEQFYQDTKTNINQGSQISQLANMGSTFAQLSALDQLVAPDRAEQFATLRNLESRLTGLSAAQQTQLSRLAGRQNFNTSEILRQSGNLQRGMAQAAAFNQPLRDMEQNIIIDNGLKEKNIIERLGMQMFGLQGQVASEAAQLNNQQAMGRGQLLSSGINNAGSIETNRLNALTGAQREDLMNRYGVASGTLDRVSGATAQIGAGIGQGLTAYYQNRAMQGLGQYNPYMQPAYGGQQQYYGPQSYFNGYYPTFQPITIPPYPG